MIRLARATAIIVSTLLGVALLWQLSGPVLVFLVSLAVAAAARGPVEYLSSRGLPAMAALAGTYIFGLLALGGLLALAICLASGEIGLVTKDFQRLYDYAADHSSYSPRLEQTLNEHLPPADELLKVVVGRHGEQAVRLVLGTAFGLLSAVVDCVFVVVLSIYWTIDREYFERLWLSLLPLPYRVSARKVWRMLESELGAYVRSEITQSLLAGAALGIAFDLLGIHFPTLLALVVGLSWLIPWLGVIIALSALLLAEFPLLVLGWPGSLVPIVAAACITVVVFMILEFVVEPRMFKRKRYNSLFIVLAVMALAQTLGILGLLLGPMVAVAIQVAIEQIEREQIAARSPANDLAALDARIAALKADAASGDELPQEWTNIVDRLAGLIAEAQEMDVEEPHLSVK